MENKEKIGRVFLNPDNIKISRSSENLGICTSNS